MVSFFGADFKIKGKIDKDKLNLVMEVNEDSYLTSFFPETCEVLRNNLPTIFNSQCFNEENKNFFEECKNTEVGHLFEHIMLEYLCMEKISLGNPKASYEGFTNWNWEKDRTGTFYIEIKIGNSEARIIKKAFKKSTVLLRKILN